MLLIIIVVWRCASCAQHYVIIVPVVHNMQDCMGAYVIDVAARKYFSVRHSVGANADQCHIQWSLAASGRHVHVGRKLRLSASGNFFEKHLLRDFYSHVW